MHLFKDSKSAFPSQERIGEFSALSVKSVRRHLEAATKKGWLKRQKNKRRGKAGIWYEYIPTIPARLKSRISRVDTMSRRENSRGDNLSNGRDNLDTTTGHRVPDDGTPCPPNQVLNPVLKQASKHSEGGNVASDVFRGRAGVEWKEGIALGRQIGFRDPIKGESSKNYLAAARHHRDHPPPANVENIKKLRRKVSCVGGKLHLEVLG